MTLEALLIVLVVGAVAGWLAGQIVRGMGFGLIGNIVVGIVGAFIAAWLLPQARHRDRQRNRRLDHPRHHRRGHPAGDPRADQTRLRRPRTLRKLGVTASASCRRRCRQALRSIERDRRACADSRSCRPPVRSPRRRRSLRPDRPMIGMRPAGDGSARMRRVASMPSMPDSAMSISTASWPPRATVSTAASPLPTKLTRWPSSPSTALSTTRP